MGGDSPQVPRVGTLSNGTLTNGDLTSGLILQDIVGGDSPSCPKKVVVTLQEIGEKAQALGVGGDSPQVPSKIGAPCKARRFCGGGAADCNVRSAIG